MRGKTRNLALMALFAAFTAVGAYIKIPLFVPITLQTFFTLLAGLTLGSRLGAGSQLVYVAIGLIGLPVFTKGGGFQYIFEPSFGYLIGLIVGAFVVGIMVEKLKSRTFIKILGCCGVAIACIYAIGATYMYFILDLYLGVHLTFSEVMMTGVIAFLPGDAITTILCVILYTRIPKLHFQVCN